MTRLLSAIILAILLLGWMLPVRATMAELNRVEIFEIDCAEAHGFAVYSEGPPSSEDSNATMDIQAPESLFGNQLSGADFTWQEGDKSLFIRMWGLPSDETRSFTVKGTYNASKNSILTVNYDGWMYNFHIRELTESIGQRGSYTGGQISQNETKSYPSLSVVAPCPDLPPSP